MCSKPASKTPKRGRPPKAAADKDERTDLLNVLELSMPGSRLSAVIALYTCDAVKMNKSCNQMRKCIELGLKSKVKVLAFGSMATELALNESDVDLYLKPRDESSMSQDELYKAIMDFLCSTEKKSKFMEASKVRRTRTPIIQCKYRPTRQNVYIHVSHPNGAYNSEFIDALMGRDKILRDLTLFLKIWARYLTNNCRLGSYCLVSMIIVSLQVQGLMPSIQWLQSSCLPGNVRGVNYSYNLDLAPPIPKKTSTLDLIAKFFDLYSTIDFEKKAVCPYLGRILDKQSILDGDVPEYTAQLQAMEAAGAEPPSPFRLITCMYVQDLFELHNNVAQTVCPPSLIEIKNWLRLASRATKDPKLRAQPKKLYYHLLFGLADEFEPKEEVEKPNPTTSKTTSSTISNKPSHSLAIVVPSCPKRQTVYTKTYFKRIKIRTSDGFVAKRRRIKC